MKHRALPVPVALAALAGALCTPLAHAGSKDVPLKATLNVEEHLGQLPKCIGANNEAPGPGGTITGSGQASHLGSVTLNASHCIAPGNGTQLVIYRGELMFTAANGDLAYGRYSGVLTPTAPGVFRFQGDFHITGGNGRFDDASGNGQLSGTYYGSPATGVIAGTITASGRVSY
ncbi:hypothetical protein [Noviherbaspirillum aerium]|uniref:hypothetical protein n=1 Tax=Noviherbaspirillum aerium TaxID=2588497 RepID=UPI00124EF867|nr:hypothetical protein [Noviherbaspirillum aerium]